MNQSAALPLPVAGCAPFVLLDDARAEGAVAARLFSDPVEVLRADRAAEVPALLDALEAAGRRGLYAAGYLAYEGGKGLAPAWRGAAPPGGGDAPLGWFGLFERVERIDADAVPGLLPDPASCWIGARPPARPRRL